MDRNSLRMSAPYCAFQFGYWVDYLIAFSFGAVLLSGRGFQPSEIGYVTTIAAILTILLQALLSTLADRSSKVTIRGTLFCLLLGSIIASLILLLVPRVYAVSFVCMFTILGLVSSVQPFMVSLCLACNAAGYHINYGVARSIGSLGYAAAGYIMGKVTEAFGAEAVLPIFAAVFTLLMILLRLIRAPSGAAAAGENRSAEKPCRFIEFFRRYRRYDLYLASVILIFFTQTIVNTYLIYFVEHYGGGKAEMGMMLSVCAFAEIPAVALGVTLLRKLSAGRMLRIASLCGIVKFSLMLIIPDIKWLIVLQLIHFFYTGFYSVSSVYYANSIVERKDTIKAQGFLSIGVTGMPGILANFTGGYLLEHTSIQTILRIGVAIAVLCFILMVIATSKLHFKGDVQEETII